MARNVSKKGMEQHPIPIKKTLRTHKYAGADLYFNNSKGGLEAEKRLGAIVVPLRHSTSQSKLG